MPRRRLVARVLVVLASVVAFAAILAVWANRQLLDTGSWTRTSSQLLEQPVIRDQVARFVVDRLSANVDVAGELAGVLPLRVQPLAAPAAGGLRDLADRGAVGALQRPRVQRVWADANRRAQLALLRLVDGGGASVSAKDGAVVLHLDAMVREIAQRTGAGGRPGSAIPAGAADLTVLRSGQLAALQAGLRVLRGLPSLLVVLSFALFGAALAVAPAWRRQAVRASGAGLMIAGAAALLTQSLTGDAVTDALASTAGVRPAVHAAWTVSTTLLVQAAVVAIGYGVAMVAGAWLAGPTPPAVAVRRALARSARRPAVAYAAPAMLVVLLLWWVPTAATSNPALALILIALLAAVAEIVRREIGREHPQPAPPSVEDRRGPAVRRYVPERSPALERLGRLRESGVLDADEVAAQRRKIRGQAHRR